MILSSIENELFFEDMEGDKSPLLKKLFEIEYEVTFKNNELLDEELEIKYES